MALEHSSMNVSNAEGFPVKRFTVFTMLCHLDDIFSVINALNGEVALYPNGAVMYMIITSLRLNMFQNGY